MLEEEKTSAEAEPVPEDEAKEAVTEKKVTKGKKAKVSTDKKAPVTKPKKVKAPASQHPKYSVMIESAIKALAERSGSSRQAILKYVTANYDLEPKKAASQLKLALKRAVAGGQLKMAKQSGKGAGCYKLSSGAEGGKKTKPKKKTEESLLPPTKKETKIKKKAVVKKPPAPKKVLVKKPATKKSAQKISKKSPKKK